MWAVHSINPENKSWTPFCVFSAESVLQISQFFSFPALLEVLIRSEIKLMNEFIKSGFGQNSETTELE